MKEKNKLEPIKQNLFNLSLKNIEKNINNNELIK